ncbi:hypothetical protein DDZ14_14115 [Maritimibacter sp. 55A14]|uniref:YraN family protein n=1 Tax=Maritimibacter sp. 55A14 TaxID=2174844 RepID=UPI000D60893F|nr:YraN family protein [Maritimibacter sp. 55A14]PWE31154.1 hypothetical protein DDZ14_14115 [Maritimibacter sp. 55A14]
MTGLTGYHAGLAAEEAVARDYLRRGHALRARRWRGKGGEIDLILDRGALTVFVEVKKSGTLDTAAARLSTRQMARLRVAAEEYLGGLPAGRDSEMRFDLACVDATGHISVIENAITD